MSDKAIAACPCCAGNDTRCLGRLSDADQFAGKTTPRLLHGGQLFICTECHLKFRHPIEDLATYAELYDNGETAIWAGEIVRHDWGQIVRYLGSPPASGCSVLDFGCNTGGFLGRLSPAYQRFGIEINQAAAAIATEQQNAKVWSSIDDIPAAQRFDVIVIADVVEHVSNPRVLVEQLMGLLSDHGRLVITTGDAQNSWWNRFGANWWYCFHPEHIAFISRPWLEYLAANSNIQLVEFKKFRYRELGKIRQIIHALFMVLYGYLPSVYLGIRDAWRSLRGRPKSSSVLGNGVSKDHLLIVLSKKYES